jgi:hypothetical protein
MSSYFHNRLKRRTNYINGYGFPRVSCSRCGGACIYLGEAVRVDLAEGDFQILHVCRSCVRRVATFKEVA